MMKDMTEIQPQITTARLTLRALRASDAGLIAMYAADERVARDTRAMPHPLPPGVIEALIVRAGAPDRTEDIWVIDASAHGLASAVGLISLVRMDRAQSEVFFWVAPAFWNNRIASEALEGLIAANPHQSARIFAEVFQDNPRSARVVSNCGFEYMGDAEAFSVARGVNVPTWTYTRKLEK